MDTIAERYEDDTRSAVESEAFELNDSDERPASPRTEGFFETAQELFICTGNWSRLRWATAQSLFLYFISVSGRRFSPSNQTICSSDGTQHRGGDQRSGLPYLTA